MKKLPSDRSFGALFTGIFAVLAAYGYFKNPHQSVWIGWLAASITTGIATLLIPKWLKPFNRAWFFIGEILGKIVSPIALGIIFFAVITPVGLITRMFGRDALRLKHENVISYWIDRTPPGPAPETFTNQF